TKPMILYVGGHWPPRGEYTKTIIIYLRAFAFCVSVQFSASRLDGLVARIAFFVLALAKRSLRFVLVWTTGLTWKRHTRQARLPVRGRLPRSHVNASYRENADYLFPNDSPAS